MRQGSGYSFEMRSPPLHSFSNSYVFASIFLPNSDWLRLLTVPLWTNPYARTSISLQVP